MNELFLNKRQPFFRFGIIQNLNLLPFDEIKKYIKEKFNQEGIAISLEHIGFIVQKTKGHPYYTQLFCQRIYFNLFGKTTVEKEDIERAYLDAILEERNFFDQLWLELLEKRHYRDCLFVSNAHFHLGCICQDGIPDHKKVKENLKRIANCESRIANLKKTEI